MPQLDKLTYFSQFFWFLLFFFTFYILICNNGDGLLGISRIFKLRNQLISNQGNKIQSKDSNRKEDILRKGFSTGVSYMYSILLEVSQRCKTMDFLGQSLNFTMISSFGGISGLRGIEQNFLHLISKYSYQTSSSSSRITLRNDIMLIHVPHGLRSFVQEEEERQDNVKRKELSPLSKLHLIPTSRSFSSSRKQEEEVNKVSFFQEEERQDNVKRKELSPLSEERLIEILDILEIDEHRFREMLDILNIDEQRLVDIWDKVKRMNELQFFIESFAFIEKSGFFSKEKQVNLVENIIQNLEEELRSVTMDSEIKPVEVDLDLEEFYDQLMTFYAQEQKAREREERAAMPDSEREALEEELRSEIYEQISFWRDILDSLQNEKEREEKDNPK